MSEGRNQYQSRETLARIRRLLWLEWDPIGVNDSAPSDEYDRYADTAYLMLMDERGDAETIAKYLYWVAAEYMGLGESEERADAARTIAKKLVALRAEFEKG